MTCLPACLPAPLLATGTLFSHCPVQCGELETAIQRADEHAAQSMAAQRECVAQLAEEKKQRTASTAAAEQLKVQAQTLRVQNAELREQAAGARAAAAKAEPEASAAEDALAQAKSKAVGAAAAPCGGWPTAAKVCVCRRLCAGVRPTACTCVSWQVRNEAACGRAAAGSSAGTWWCALFLQVVVTLCVLCTLTMAGLGWRSVLAMRSTKSGW